jgi:hypothetical protein
MLAKKRERGNNYDRDEQGESDGRYAQNFFYIELFFNHKLKRVTYNQQSNKLAADYMSLASAKANRRHS